MKDITIQEIFTELLINRCKSLSLTYFPLESHEGKAFLLEDANRNDWLMLLSHATPVEDFNLGK